MEEESIIKRRFFRLSLFSGRVSYLNSDGNMDFSVFFGLFGYDLDLDLDFDVGEEIFIKVRIFFLVIFSIVLF